MAASCLLAGCAVANNDDATAPRDSGHSTIDGESPGDSGPIFSSDETSTEDPDSSEPDTSAPDTGTASDPDTGTVDTSVTDTGSVDTSVTDTGSVAMDTSIVVPETGCGTTTIAPTLGTTCAGAVPIDMGSACVQTYEGDSCTGATISTSCGAGQAQIYAISIATGARLYAIKVSDGFSLAVIPGIAPFCGGAGSCVGSGMSTGVGAGSTQFWTVLKTGGGCGTYTLTITPS